MPKNINKFTIYTQISFCPFCDRKFSGKEKTVNKLTEMHIKSSHPNEEIVRLGNRLESRCKLYKEREKNDTELKDTISNLLNLKPINKP